jgi:hypothetical protein
LYERDLRPEELLEGDTEAILIFLRNTSFGSEYNVSAVDPQTGEYFIEIFSSLVESDTNPFGQSFKLEKYQIIVTSVGSSPYTLYQTVPVANVTTVDTTNKQITVLNANNMTANIISTIDYTLASGNPAKTKSIVYESSTIQTSGGESINSNGVIVYSANGQTTIEANNIIKTPNELQSLYVPDVYQLISVYDFNGTAVSNTGYNDVTSRYTLNNGQRDSHYDHASIQLKAGLPAPKGPIVVRYRAYSSSTGGGFYSADSYPDYGIIPSHISTSGTIYALRDCLDFRPVRKAETAAIGTSVIFDTNPSTHNTSSYYSNANPTVIKRSNTDHPANCKR